jgi:hypothetical protein
MATCIYSTDGTYKCSEGGSSSKKKSEAFENAYPTYATPEPCWASGNCGGGEICRTNADCDSKTCYDYRCKHTAPPQPAPAPQEPKKSEPIREEDDFKWWNPLTWW